jgi:fructose/tagatose bisphosphate aldolase
VTQVGELTRVAHARGIAVEGELGRLPDFIGGDVDESQASFTDPKQAAAFVAQTGVDCLAVSIGNVHLLTTRYALVDLEHLEAISRRISTPLVIHGGTSFPPDAAPRAIAAGVVKFNVGTVLKRAFFAGLRQSIQAQPETADVHLILGSHKSADVMNAGKARMSEKIQELMHVYGSGGRA